MSEKVPWRKHSNAYPNCLYWNPGERNACADELSNMALIYDSKSEGRLYFYRRKKGEYLLVSITDPAPAGYEDWTWEQLEAFVIPLLVAHELEVG
jgi:hypothetical protein